MEIRERIEQKIKKLYPQCNNYKFIFYSEDTIAISPHNSAYTIDENNNMVIIPLDKKVEGYRMGIYTKLKTVIIRIPISDLYLFGLQRPSCDKKDCEFYKEHFQDPLELYHSCYECIHCGFRFVDGGSQYRPKKVFIENE